MNDNSNEIIPIENTDKQLQQKIFNQVANKLLKQGKACVHPEGKECSYRDGKGNKCAAGWLIKDKDYVDSMEGQGAYALEIFKRLPPSTIDLVDKLQHVHDMTLTHFGIKTWAKKMIKIANEYGLEYK